MKSKEKKDGTVYFVGAGPGDPGLITVKGARLLSEADVVVHDLFVHPALLDLASSAKLVYVGKDLKRKSHNYVEQKKINTLLVRYARAGNRVVRLKGGDPFVFGRGGEEALHLKKHGVRFEVVSGVSAGQAVPAYAGIPLTERSKSSLAVFVTGHEDVTKRESAVQWSHLAHLNGTIVLFMGIRNLKAITAHLIRAGKPGRTPVSVLERGTLEEQRIVEGNLSNIAARAVRAGVESPSLVVIGEVNRLRKKLSWFKQKPLSGKSVLITRAGTQAGRLREALEKSGARVLESPAVSILPPENFSQLDRAIQKIASYDWVVFASTNAVDFFFNRMRAQKRDARNLGCVKIAAVGCATEEALVRHGIRADFVPAKFNAAELVRGLNKKREVNGKRFLLPRTDIATPELKKALEAKGAKTEQVITYRTVTNKSGSGKLEQWLSQDALDYVAFTSASTVRGFLNSVSPARRKQFQKNGKPGSRPKFISIGPVTDNTLREFGMRSYRIAAEASIPGLVRAMARG